MNHLNHFEVYSSVFFIRKKLENFCGLSGGKLVAGLRTEQKEVREMA